MNILVFSWRDLRHPLAGGAEQVDHEHHKGWIEAGHKVTLFSSMFPGADKTDVIDGVNIIRNGNQILGVQIVAFFWYLFINKQRFDLIVDEFHGIPFFTPLYVKKPKMAVLQEVARDVWLKNDLHFPFNFIIGYLGYYLEPLIFNFYKNVPFIVGSESAKLQLLDVNVPSKNIWVVNHGVILDLPKKRILREKTKTIIFLGALAKDKGIEDAIKTFGILNKTDKYQFWIVGKGGEDYLRELKMLVKQEQIESNTKFWGFVSQKKKFELLSKAHLMVNPSLLEGFGLVNIEANSCGTPVVSYNSPGLVDSVKNNVSGVIVNKNTPDELSKTANMLLKNKIRYKKLQRTSLQWSKNFNWNQSRKLSVDLINKYGLE